MTNIKATIFFYFPWRYGYAQVNEDFWRYWVFFKRKKWMNSLCTLSITDHWHATVLLILTIGQIDEEALQVWQLLNPWQRPTLDEVKISLPKSKTIFGSYYWRRNIHTCHRSSTLWLCDHDTPFNSTSSMMLSCSYSCVMCLISCNATGKIS